MVLTCRQSSTNSPTNVLVDRAPSMQVLFENDSSTVAQAATGTGSVHYMATKTWTQETDTTFDTSIRGAANWDWNSGQWLGVLMTCS